MRVYVATINVPGYLPMADELATFDSAAEAWAYLADERERHEDDFEGDAYSDTYNTLLALASVGAESGEGTVYGTSPGDGQELAYSVELVDLPADDS